MTFRSICIAVYVFFYLIFTTPERIRLKKLEQTDPQELLFSLETTVVTLTSSLPVLPSPVV